MASSCGPSGDSLSRRRNDLAVLAVLANRSPAAIRREEMQTLFWGERPEENARHSLRQVVLQLRRVCGPVAKSVSDAGSGVATRVSTRTLSNV